MNNNKKKKTNKVSPQGRNRVGGERFVTRDSAQVHESDQCAYLSKIKVALTMPDTMLSFPFYCLIINFNHDFLNNSTAFKHLNLQFLSYTSLYQFQNKAAELGEIFPIPLFLVKSSSYRMAGITWPKHIAPEKADSTERKNNIVATGNCKGSGDGDTKQSNNNQRA